VSGCITALPCGRWQARRLPLRRFPAGPAAVNFRYPDGFRQTEELQDLDLHPGQIQLIPHQAKPRRTGMGVMVVVPALAGGQQGHPPVVPGIIARGESAAAPQVRHRVDQPGRVEADDDPEADPPQLCMLSSACSSMKTPMTRTLGERTRDVGHHCADTLTIART
jgi:hypothetical protein